MSTRKEFPRIMNLKRHKPFFINPSQKNSSKIKKTSLKSDKTLSITSATQAMNKSVKASSLPFKIGIGNSTNASLWQGKTTLNIIEKCTAKNSSETKKTITKRIRSYEIIIL